jgi:hypothetical protein
MLISTLNRNCRSSWSVRELRHSVAIDTNPPIGGLAPTTPDMGARSLVLWIGDHHGPVLAQPSRDVVGSVAMRLHHAPRNRTVLRRARVELGIGVAFDTEAWRNQCRPDHLLRAPAFRERGFDVRDVFGRSRLNIDQPLAPRQIEEYAAAHLDAQVPFDPTIFQCPGHLPSGVVALNNDVALAEATLDLVDGRALREARAGDKHERRRSVFATVCVRSGDLSAESTRAIVERYVTLDVDGFWVLPFGYQPSGRQTERVLALTLALQENSGLPAVPGAMRNLWQAALARGAAAAVAGPERAALAVDLDEAPPPPPEREPDEEDAPKDGRQVAAYHGAILSAFGFDERGMRARARVFERNLCGCGFHDADSPPPDQKATAAHNQWWRLLEARRACVGSAADAAGRLEGRFAGAREERLAAGIKSGLPVGWRRSLEPWERMPVGWGAADGRSATG